MLEGWPPPILDPAGPYAWPVTVLSWVLLAMAAAVLLVVLAALWLALFGGERLSSYAMDFADIDANLLAIEYDDFAGAILDGRPPEVTGADGLRFGVELEHVAIAGDGSFVVSYERPAGTGGSMTTRRVLVRDSGGIVVRRARDGRVVAVFDVPGVTTLAAAPDGKSFAFTSSKQLPRLALVSAPR